MTSVTMSLSGHILLRNSRDVVPMEKPVAPTRVYMYVLRVGRASDGRSEGRVAGSGKGAG